MNYRNSILLSPKDVGAAGTEVIDLDFPDVISRLTIIFNVINPGSITIQEVPAANVPKIELVDGSNVVASLTGMQAHAINFFDTGEQYSSGGSYVAAWGLVFRVALNFGRFLFDPIYALNPKKFTNLQLKITYDEDAAVASAVVNTLTVIADLFDDKAAAPTAFLMNKEIFAYTPTAGASESVDLPSDYPYRKLILQARVPDLWFGAIISNLKLSENNDSKIPFDLTSSLLENWIHQLYGEYRDGIIANLNTVTGVDIFHAPTQGVKLRGDFYCTSDVLDNIPFGYRNLYKTATMTGYTVMDITGTMPHGCLCIPFGNQQDPTDWYDMKGKVIKLIVRAGTSIGASEEFHVIAQQVRAY